MKARGDDSDDLAIVIHELRNPLVAIDAAARVLARDLGAHAASERASAIASEARHLLGLLESVLEADAAASGRLRSAPRRIDLAALVRECVVGSPVAGHPVELRGAEAPVPVDADPQRMRQVLSNLLTNAAQYSPPGMPIEVSIGARGRVARVTVRDHGPGIPASERRKLFHKFMRLSTADGTRGSGLGLYICRAIVVEHRGSVSFEPAKGGGSTFSIQLPMRRSARAGDVVRRPAASRREGASRPGAARGRKTNKEEGRTGARARTERRDATGRQPGASPARALRRR